MAPLLGLFTKSLFEKPRVITKPFSKRDFRKLRACSESRRTRKDGYEEILNRL